MIKGIIIGAATMFVIWSLVHEFGDYTDDVTGIITKAVKDEPQTDCAWK